MFANNLQIAGRTSMRPECAGLQGVWGSLGLIGITRIEEGIPVANTTCSSLLSDWLFELVFARTILVRGVIMCGFAGVSLLSVEGNCAIHTSSYWFNTGLQ